MKYLLIILLALTSCVPKAESLNKVIVSDNDHKEIVILESSEKLSEIQSAFLAKEEVEVGIKPEWKYFIDFNPGERWLYSEDGYMQVLAMKVTPVYKLKNAERFNELLNLNK